MILAEWTVAQAVWTLFWAGLMWAIFIAWIMLVLRLFGDIMRNDGLGGTGKGLWALFVLAVPFLGVFMYIITNGQGWNERQYGIAS